MNTEIDPLQTGGGENIRTKGKHELLKYEALPAIAFIALVKQAANRKDLRGIIRVDFNHDGIGQLSAWHHQSLN